MTFEMIISIIVGLVTIFGVLVKLVFDCATLKATTNQILNTVLDIKKYLADHDKRLDDLEKRVTILETQHNANHKE